MALTKQTHWLGAVLLFTASMPPLIATISTPIINHSGLLHITLANFTTCRHSSINFGTFGCGVLDVPPAATVRDYCTGRHIGYDPSTVTTRATDTSFTTTSTGPLTRVMVLHPIATDLTFIAFLVTIGGRTLSSSLSGVLVTLLTWVLMLVSLAVDFTIFGLVRHAVNTQASGWYPKARFESARWCLVAGFVALSLGLVIIAGSLLGAVRERRAVKKGAGHGATGSARGSG